MAEEDRNRGEFRVGTSGWSYQNWKGPFYPKGLKAHDWLPFYGTHFSSVEVNATFYRLPAEKTVTAWAERTPDGFLFAVKGWRAITHFRRLAECTDLADIAGTLSLSRISMLPLMGGTGDTKYLEVPLGCTSRPKPQCADGKDNDGDKKADDRDPSCGAHPFLLGYDESADQTCNDLRDNDGDQLKDHQDPDCMEKGGREEQQKPPCSDGVDNDGDKLVDLKDPGC